MVTVFETAADEVGVLLLTGDGVVECAEKLVRLATISEAHKTAGHEPPTRSARVGLVWARIRRDFRGRQTHRKPVLTPNVRAMLDALPDSLVGLRDRAVVLLGFVGAMRRSELVSLDVTDLAHTDDGTRRADQRIEDRPDGGAGENIGIPFGMCSDTCPVNAVTARLSESKPDAGPVFRPVRTGTGSCPTPDTRLCDRTVAQVVTRALAEAGKTARRFSGHSLRFGLITQAAM